MTHPPLAAWHRLVESRDAAGLDAREVEERVDETEQPQPVAVRHLERRAMRRKRLRLGRERVGEGTEQQRQRSPELVADVREERRLGPVDLGERLGPFALGLVGLGVGDGARDLAGGKAEERTVAVRREMIYIGRPPGANTPVVETGEKGPAVIYKKSILRGLCPALH